MKVTRKTKTTKKLGNLERGMVFTLPHHEEATYMVINEHDYFINSNAIISISGEIVFIDLEDGKILSLDAETEVILVNGSFVVSDD